MNKSVRKLIYHLKNENLTLALAESMTCGLAAHQLSTCPGTSEVLKGSIVCYSPEIKKELFGISEKQIKKFTCESKEITQYLALRLKRLIRADIYAALTGLASAGGSETKQKPVGTVFFSLNYKSKMYQQKVVFRGSPLEIRKKACKALYEFIYKVTKKRS